MKIKGKYSSKNTYSHAKFGKYKNDTIYDFEIVNKISVQNDQLKFTNKFERVTGQRNDSIRSILNILQGNPNDFFHYFVGKEISLQTSRDVYKIKRLDDIINLNEKKPEKKEIIWKYKLNNNYDDGAFQLFVTYKDSKIKVYLIDLYHLGIPSKTNRDGSNFNLSEEYEKRKKYKKCISECIY